MTIKLVDVDDELMYKSYDMSVGTTKLRTPIKASNHYCEVKEINEIYKKFDDQKIVQCIANADMERRVNSEINRLKTGKINFLFIEYNSLQPLTEEYAEYLSDVAYVGDVVITPILSRITRELTENRLKEVFIHSVNLFLEYVETLNNKTIMGVIPSRIPRQFLGDILENYLRWNVTSFVLDFDGRSIDASFTWLRRFMILLKENGLFDETLIYLINPNPGRFMKNADRILAKDFIGGGFGMDILGLNHVPPRMPTESWIKIKEKRRENTYRMFNRRTYGYHRIQEGALPSFLRNRGALNAYNIVEQYNEASVLRRILSEESTVEKYILEKDLVRENEKILSKMKSVRKIMK